MSCVPSCGDLWKRADNVCWDVKYVQLSFKNNKYNHSAVTVNRNTFFFSFFFCNTCGAATAEYVILGWRTLNELVFKLLKIVFMTTLMMILWLHPRSSNSQPLSSGFRSLKISPVGGQLDCFVYVCVYVRICAYTYRYEETITVNLNLTDKCMNDFQKGGDMLSRRKSRFYSHCFCRMREKKGRSLLIPSKLMSVTLSSSWTTTVL